MLSLEFITEFLIENVEDVTITQNGLHFHGRCPLCGDSKKSRKKKRFHLQYDSENSIYWRCWNCGESGSFPSLYARLNSLSNEEVYRELFSFSYDNIDKLLSSKKQSKKSSSSNKNQEKKYFDFILEDCIDETSIPSGHFQKILQNKLIEFKKNRGVNIPIYIAYKGDYKNRIIIPVFENDHIVYFQARRSNENIEPKYLNPSAEKESIILNKEKFNSNYYIVVTEGLLDAYSIGNQGTTCLGRSFSDDFLARLIAIKGDKNIILAFDNDRDGMKELRKFIGMEKEENRSKYSISMKYFLMPYEYKNTKDINSLYMQTNKNIYDFVVNHSYDYLEAKIRLNMDKWRSIS